MESMPENTIEDKLFSEDASLPLAPAHWADLQKSGITRETAQARGYRTVSGPGRYSDLKPLGFSRVQCPSDGLLVPVLGIDGKPTLYQFRPDTPRLNRDSKPIKYETPAKASMRLDFGVGQQELLKNPTIPIYITEGIKKVDALQSQ